MVGIGQSNTLSPQSTKPVAASRVQKLTSEGPGSANCSWYIKFSGGVQRAALRQVLGGGAVLRALQVHVARVRGRVSRVLERHLAAVVVCGVEGCGREEGLLVLMVQHITECLIFRI